jgi:hypothetical protein
VVRGCRHKLQANGAFSRGHTTTKYKALKFFRTITYKMTKNRACNNWVHRPQFSVLNRVINISDVFRALALQNNVSPCLCDQSAHKTHSITAAVCIETHSRLNGRIFME